MTTNATSTWRQWLMPDSLPEELFAQQWLDQPFSVTEQDRKAAWVLYTELRTRITTQPLHYRSGNERRALTSLFELFGQARQAIHDHGPECRNFAILATVILNRVVRPFTAKWHKRKEAGELDLEYVRHEFRAELAQLQRKLLPFQRMLGRLAEGEAFVPETATSHDAAGQEADADEEQITTNEDSWWPAAAADRKRLLLGDRDHDGVLNRPINFDLNLPEQVPAEQRNAIRDKEQTVIQERRTAVGLAADSVDPIGLAISGGGIRSSTFALGVLQRLAQQGVLREVDFLSTVSGGGYVGSFLSSYLNSPPAETSTNDRGKSLHEPSADPLESSPADPPAAPSSDSREAIGLRPGELPFLGPNDNESPALRWIRNRSKYLIFGGRIRRLQIYGLAVYGVLINLFVTLPLVALAALLTKGFYGDQLARFGEADRWYPAPGWPGTLLLGALAFAALLALLLGPVQMFCSRSQGWPKWFLRKYELVGVWTLPVLLLIAFVNVLPVATYGANQLLQALADFEFPISAEETDSTEETGGMQSLIAVLGTALLPVLTAIGSYLARNRRILGTLMRGLFALSGPLFFLTSYLLLVNWAIVKPTNETQMVWGMSMDEWLWVMFLVPTVYGLWLLNVNFSSPHRFYRNRLSEAYLIQENPRGTSTRTASEHIEHVDAQKLSKLRNNNPAAPYHLINTALNLPGSIEPELRGRDCDFFLFSPEYCGSVLTGYMETEKLEALDWHIDLGTAMSISGAAAAPYMGVHSVRPARFLLTLLNIRLSYWLPNPGCHSAWCRTLRYAFPANATYLFREMFGRLRHDRSRVNLSDGGHIENLGLYELLRRRCKFIVAIDGEQDNELARASLLRVMRYAAIDLNADIRFPDLQDIVKDEHGFSASHFALGVIRYQPLARERDTGPDIGVILYFKSSLTGNEPATVLDYQRLHPDFPHQTTADQFFEEDQYEAYRALGCHVAGEALRPELFDGPPPDDLTIRDWFRTLTSKLFSD
ncbi:MAG: patatin-like phospholipase family protein [Candidatus Paceibacterota bacterium]